MDPNPVSNSLVKDPDWWRGAVIYQIYPRSFQDSTGSGTGDLKGIAARLPHIADLGADAIWISPFFKSPMADFGYDVSDYCDVDPMFGTLADFDAVISTAHSLGVKVMIDLVLSHTSDQHPWFQASRLDRNNDKSNWYVWADPKPDGTPPNNWLSIFGGSAWQWSGQREQYFLHNFLTSQPDLNFHEPQVQDALLDVARFWLHRGVDGFRLDTINFYIHDKDLPYNHQEHIYSKNQPENLDFLRKLRAVMQPFNAAAVGEVGDAQRGMEILGEYTAGDDLMHMCYAFEFLSNAKPDAGEVAAVMNRLDDNAPDGWACWAFSNHDVKRHATRWDMPPAGLRVMTTLMMCLRGSACIYQGEELGLHEADVAFEDLQDPYGIEFWPEFKGRDGCRTPMVWEQSNVHGGFSAAARTWFPVSHDHIHQSVSVQEDDPSAIIHHYRRAIALRHAHPALAKGDHDGVKANGDVVYFTRTQGRDSILCVFNLSDSPSTFALPAGDWRVIGQDVGSADVSADGKLHLGPWQPFIAAAQT